MRGTTNAVAGLGCALALFLGGEAYGQGFSSGSTGADGALNIAGGQGTIDFDPTGLDTDQDGVFHFTTITVGAGTTVRFRANTPGLAPGKPVVWLASGAVTISGILDLNGENGHGGGSVPNPSVPGPGGFEGGPGGTVSADFPKAGAGPGGGCAGDATTTTNGGNASYRTQGSKAANEALAGQIYGNRYQLPLKGGSGGGGARNGAGGGGGGAGGGAILIASSVSITFSGSPRIEARGGNGNNGGGAGSGGAIRLMAPFTSGSATLNVLGGNGGGSGWVRLEAFTHSPNVITSPPAIATFSRPGLVFLPSTAPTVRVTMVGAQAVPANPTGSDVNPDVTLTSTVAVTLSIAATNIPPGTTVQLKINPDNGPSLTIVSNPLTGNLSASTTTAGPVSLPSGFTRIHVTATWSP